MTTPLETFHWRKLNADERALFAQWCIERGYTGMMFVETQSGEHVLMVIEKVEAKPDTNINTEEH